MIENISSQLHASLSENPFEAVNFRKIFLSELFSLGLKEVSSHLNYLNGFVCPHIWTVYL